MEKDVIRVKVPEHCFKCRWGKESSIAKIKCANRYAVVVKENEGWMCHSYHRKY